jgi:hypothetical protein
MDTMTDFIKIVLSVLAIILWFGYFIWLMVNNILNKKLLKLKVQNNITPLSSLANDVYGKLHVYTAILDSSCNIEYYIDGLKVTEIDFKSSLGISK